MRLKHQNACQSPHPVDIRKPPRLPRRPAHSRNLNLVCHLYALQSRRVAPASCRRAFSFFTDFKSPIAHHPPTRPLPHPRPLGCPVFRRRPLRLLARLRRARPRPHPHPFFLLLSRDASFFPSPGSPTSPPPPPAQHTLPPPRPPHS